MGLKPKHKDSRRIAPPFGNTASAIRVPVPDCKRPCQVSRNPARAAIRPRVGSGLRVDQRIIGDATQVPPVDLADCGLGASSRRRSARAAVLDEANADGSGQILSPPPVAEDDQVVYLEPAVAGDERHDQTSDSEKDQETVQRTASPTNERQGFEIDVAEGLAGQQLRFGEMPSTRRRATSAKLRQMCWKARRRRFQTGPVDRVSRGHAKSPRSARR